MSHRFLSRYGTLAGALAIVILWLTVPSTASESASSQAPGRGLSAAALIDGGRERSYWVYVPSSYTGASAVPLLLAFHGGMGNARSFMQQTGLNGTAEREGCIVVYPNGTGVERAGRQMLTWNAGACCGAAQRQRVDDVGFIRQLIERVSAQLRIDRSRIYATGMSNGAMLTYALACQLPGTLTAIAPVSGSVALSGCQWTSPVSVIHFHGTEDQRAPLLGGRGSQSLTNVVHPAIPDTIARVRALNGCTDESETRRVGDTTFVSYRCPTRVGVVLATIEGGGHAWPGALRVRAGGDRSSREMRANDEMWSFFNQVAE